MIRVSDRDVNGLLRYVVSNFPHGLYIYLDIAQYGLHNKNLEVWIDSSVEIGLTVMRYYKGMQVLSHRSNLDYEALSRFIKSKKVNVVSGSEYIIKGLSPYFMHGIEEYGLVAKYAGKHLLSTDERVEEANLNDMPEIAQLICSDVGIGGHYDRDGLAKQLTSRHSCRFGRNKVIRSEGIIVSHAATYAESGDLAVLSGVVTNRQDRSKGLGKAVTTCLVQELVNEGKEVFLYVYVPGLMDFYRQIGFEVAGECGKITMNSIS